MKQSIQLKTNFLCMFPPECLMKIYLVFILSIVSYLYFICESNVSLCPRKQIKAEILVNVMWKKSLSTSHRNGIEEDKEFLFDFFLFCFPHKWHGKNIVIHQCDVLEMCVKSIREEKTFSSPFKRNNINRNLWTSLSFLLLLTFVTAFIYIFDTQTSFNER